MNFEDLLLIGGLLVALAVIGGSNVHARQVTGKNGHAPAARIVAVTTAGHRC